MAKELYKNVFRTSQFMIVIETHLTNSTFYHGGNSGFRVMISRNASHVEGSQFDNYFFTENDLDILLRHLHLAKDDLDKLISESDTMLNG